MLVAQIISRKFLLSFLILCKGRYEMVHDVFSLSNKVCDKTSGKKNTYEFPFTLKQNNCMTNTEPKHLQTLCII